MRWPRHLACPSWLAALALAACLLAISPASPAVIRSHVHAEASPQTVVLHPDGTNGTDTFIESLLPLWNFGADPSLAVGPNATNGGLARSLLRFNVGMIPSNATVVDATLRLRESQGSGGSVEAHRLAASWTEGSGGHSWTVLPVVVRETAGVNRTLEPIGVTVPFQSNSISQPPRDLRVYDGGVEVPSQVYAFAYSGGSIASAKVFFPVTLGSFGTKTYDIVYSTNGTSVPSYRTRTWGTSPVWTYGPTGGGASGATVADIDNDGRLEIVFGGTDGYVYCLDDTGQLKWRSPVSVGWSIPFTPQVAYADRSGTMSIYVSTNAPSVVRLNSTGSPLWTYPAPAILFTTPTLVDVNGDGVLDALVGTNNRDLSVIDGALGTALPAFPVQIAAYTATIADINGDGTPEVLVDGDDRAIHAFRLDRSEIWAGAAPGGSFLEGSIAFGDVNGDGFPEVVTGDNGNNGLEFALYASNGTVAWSTDLPSYREGGQTIAALSSGAPLSTIVGMTSGPVYNLRGTDGVPVWSYLGSPVQAGTPVVTDLDNSNTPEIVFIQGGTVAVLDTSGLLQHSWSILPPNLNLRNSVQYPMTSPALADLTGDGTLEVLVPTANGLEAFATGGLDHDWRTWGYNVNHTNRAGDGASGTGAALLDVSLGATKVFPAAGTSWNYRDGTNAWASPGAVFGLAEATSILNAGWMSWNVSTMVQDWVAGRSPNDGIALVEGSEVTGTFHTFPSGEATDASVWPSLTITYVLGSGPGGVVYPPQIVGAIPDLSRPENSAPFSVDLTPYAYDNSTPLSQLRWNVTGYDTRVFQITGLETQGNYVLTIYPQPMAFGNYHVTYWLTDPGGRYDRAEAWINITYTDQPPSFNPPPALYVHYNDTYRFDFGPYIYDPDTPSASLALRSNDTVHTQVDGFNVSFLYGSGFLDRWSFVNLTVSDGSHNVSRLLAVKVTADNPPVLLKPIPDQVLWEGQVLVDAFNLGDYFTDPNNDSLYYTTGYTHLYIIIHTNRSVDVGAIANWWGQESVTFRATDPTGAIVEDTILVTVVHLARPPSIGPVPDLRVRFDTPYSFNLDPYLSDPDTSLALLNVTVSNAHVTVSGHLMTFFYAAAYNNTVENVTLQVSDGTFTVAKTIRVTVGSDWPPVIRGKMPDTSFPENSILRGAYNLSDYFADPDSSLLYWSSGNLNVFITIHPNGSVDLSARPSWDGVERVTFRATDDRGGLAEDSVWVTVVPVNYAPFFRPVPQQVVNMTTSYVPLTTYLGDPDDNVTELVLTGTNSTHATVIGQGILLSYSADTTEYIRVVVSDGRLTNETTIVVRVLLPAQVVVPPIVIQEIPGFLYWLPVPLALAALGVFLMYRYRQLEWVFLVTKDGLLVSSISRSSDSTIDTDLITGMLTAIMDFANKSFSDIGEERHLEGLELGEKRVAIVKGEVSYLAVVYRGRTPGSLLRIMRSLLTKIEAEHQDALGTIIDSTKLGDIPGLLQHLVTRGSLPFVAYRIGGARKA